MTGAADAYLARLQHHIADDVPLARASGVQLAFDAAGTIRADAPFAPNRNMHGTVFGGSLYTVSLVCGFAQTRWLVEQAGLNAHVVIRQARADYHRPIRGPLAARIQAPPDAAPTRFLDELEYRQRADLALEITMNMDGQRAFTLNARFAALIPAQRPTTQPSY